MNYEHSYVVGFGPTLGILILSCSVNIQIQKAPHGMSEGSVINTKYEGLQIRHLLKSILIGHVYPSDSNE